MYFNFNFIKLVYNIIYVCKGVSYEKKVLHGKVEAARTQEDRRQIRMLEGGCNNLNQLAKLAHQQGFSLLKGKIMDLLGEFNKIIERI